jgi:hypothetical protein
LESFSYELQFDMHFYMHSYLHKIFILVKSGCYRVDVDGLACPLHHPMSCSHQTRRQGLLPGPVLSHRCSGWLRLPGGCEAPRLGYFCGELTIWVHALPNLTWGQSLLPRHAYLMLEPS